MAISKPIMSHLKVLLGNEVEYDIVSYISSMKQVEDLEEFMENVVDRNNTSHIRALNAIKDIMFSKKPPNSSGQKTNQHKPLNPSSSSTNNKKEKKKFRDINDYQQVKKEKQGRSACDCMGQEHDFMNNCPHCGRIHCAEEGPGPCLFCGNPITYRGQDLMDTKSIKQKNKHKENKVFDDDNDYFKINSKKNAQEDKRKMVIALDFATRKVIEGTQEDAKIRERLLKESMEHLKKVEQVYQNLQQVSQSISHHKAKRVNVKDELVELLIQMRHKKPAGVEDIGEEDSTMPILDYGTRVFDEDLMATMDHGMCISLHQPYASLLVAGVKQHEGRTWPTSHRGRIWIAAAAKAPEEDEISALEGFYREYYKDTTLKFPKEYPTSCLLGCVFVEDCLEQEAYRKKFPNGESNSPFVLICSNPIILPIFYGIVGKHKIYPLEKDLHKCAKMALQHAKYVM